MKKIKKNIEGCEIEGEMDLSNEEKPRFKVKIKGDCEKLNLDKL